MEGRGRGGGALKMVVSLGRPRGDRLALNPAGSHSNGRAGDGCWTGAGSQEGSHAHRGGVTKHTGTSPAKSLSDPGPPALTGQRPGPVRIPAGVGVGGGGQLRLPDPSTAACFGERVKE